MNYKPFGNRVVGILKKQTGDKKTESGILFVPTNTETERYDELEVVAVGRGYVTQNGQLVPMEAKIGDIVLVMKNSALPLPKNGSDVEYAVFQESDIIAHKGSVETVQ